MTINKLLQTLRIKMKNKDLLLQALTHSSYSNEYENSPHNERLEFLGDAVIGLLMADYLYKKGLEDEGQLSKKRAQAVCEEALYKYATRINLSSKLRLGRGLELAKARENPAIIADAFEALFGAVYLDSGYREVKKLFHRVIVPNLKEIKEIKDFKSTLQEFVQIDRRNVSYHLEAQKGPSHKRIFTVSVKVDGIVMGIGEAKTKKEAEQKAAEVALGKLAKEIKDND
ncbi:MAG: ribonuclease III [Acholeplasmataceae bacterium]|jgi:ribonuclease-3|nr:ribonuclease III [Acholeplasmataceae bacterium]